MCIYGMWPWKVPKWPWFWAEVAVKAWRDLATLPFVRTLCDSNTLLTGGAVGLAEIVLKHDETRYFN
jgi:hypothetical protein